MLTEKEFSRDAQDHLDGFLSNPRNWNARHYATLKREHLHVLHPLLFEPKHKNVVGMSWYASAVSFGT